MHRSVGCVFSCLLSFQRWATRLAPVVSAVVFYSYLFFFFFFFFFFLSFLSLPVAVFVSFILFHCVTAETIFFH